MQGLIGVINKAQRSLDIAIYELIATKLVTRSGRPQSGRRCPAGHR
jgi:hypothetical protein